MKASRSATSLVGAALQVLLLAVPANGQETTRVSVDSSGVEGNYYSLEPSISADGQVVAFSSSATNLVAGDTNVSYDVFLHDRATGITERLSVDSSGAEGNSHSNWPSISVVDGQILANSYGNSTVGLVLVGYQKTLVPTNKGGDLLVVIASLISVPLGPGGVSIVGDFPADDALCGFEIFAQALELDPGAAKGMSFTAGLELVLGH